MAQNGTGTQIQFGSGFFAEILDITPAGMERKSIDTSHMGTSTNKTFIPGDLVDNGNLEVEIAFDPDAIIPIADASESVVITFPDSTTWTFSAFMTAFKPKTPLEDRMTAQCTLKISGAIMKA